MLTRKKLTSHCSTHSSSSTCVNNFFFLFFFLLGGEWRNYPTKVVVWIQISATRMECIKFRYHHSLSAVGFHIFSFPLYYYIYFLFITARVLCVKKSSLFIAQYMMYSATFQDKNLYIYTIIYKCVSNNSHLFQYIGNLGEKSVILYLNLSFDLWKPPPVYTRLLFTNSFHLSPYSALAIAPEVKGIKKKRTEGVARRVTSPVAYGVKRLCLRSNSSKLPCDPA